MTVRNWYASMKLTFRYHSRWKQVRTWTRKMKMVFPYPPASENDTESLLPNMSYTHQSPIYIVAHPCLTMRNNLLRLLKKERSIHKTTTRNWRVSSLQNPSDWKRGEAAMLNQPNRPLGFPVLLKIFFFFFLKKTPRVPVPLPREHIHWNRVQKELPPSQCFTSSFMFEVLQKSAQW